MSSDIKARLFDAFIEGLLNRIKAGEATASDFEVARKFLKDQEITTTEQATPELADLKAALPFHTDDRRTG